MLVLLTRSEQRRGREREGREREGRERGAEGGRERASARMLTNSLARSVFFSCLSLRERAKKKVCRVRRLCVCVREIVCACLSECVCVCV